MNIKKYIESQPISKAQAIRELADSLGVAPVTVKKWMLGSRHPRRHMWMDIVQATKGAVTIYALAID